ncbi:Lrp/AsnC family transcriptional regulator [Streptomyces showdoensis]|uniref:AsnC family transcriptional regulator n=1 Tax=Streptomyces showdoensis TaxID=68268 RepID=A0A2P2GI73_STREW|nr:Lrp/AsnC family transcriptional regulator [Streptomyces showdoensis]KKZ71220.1 AsnC family transcriptional regulator [Streptomyces showdoensis]
MPSGESVLGEPDLALIHALQLVPRASWTQLSAVLGAGPDTLARRWEHLTTGGYAWAGFLVRHHGPRAPLYAWVEVDCAAGRSEETAIELTGDPYTLGVHEVTGDTDLVLLVLCPDLEALDAYLSLRVQRLPGVTRSRTQVVTGVHSARNLWQLDQLTPRQARQLTGAPVPVQGRPAVSRRRTQQLTELDEALVLELAGDARRSAAELARTCGASESTVRRRLEALIGGETLIHHCVPAPRFSGRPVWALIRADVPSLAVASTAAAMARLRQTRLVTSVTGGHNLAVGAWLRSVGELHDITTAMERAAPSLRITGTALSLRTHKSGAQVLGPDGRRLHHVRPDLRTPHWKDRFV